MFKIYKKHLVIELEDNSDDIYKFGAQHLAKISFKTDENSQKQDFATIKFEFEGFNAKTPKGVLYIDNFFFDLQTKKIRSWCNCMYDFVEIGIMDNFETPEQAIAILEQVMKSIKE